MTIGYLNMNYLAPECLGEAILESNTKPTLAPLVGGKHDGIESG